MTVLRPALVVIVVVVFSLSFALPGENIAETVYDESESLPCESTPAISDAVAATSAEEPAVQPVYGGTVSVHREGPTREIFTPGPTAPASSPNSLTILNRSLRC